MRSHRLADVDVMMPSTDGTTIVFLHDGFIHLLNIASGEVKKISVECPSDRWALRTKAMNPKDYVHSAGVSNDGKKRCRRSARRSLCYANGKRRDKKPFELSRHPRTVSPILA